MNLINGAGPDNPGGNDEIGWRSSVNSFFSLVVAIPSNLYLTMMLLLWTIMILFQVVDNNDSCLLTFGQ